MAFDCDACANNGRRCADCEMSIKPGEAPTMWARLLDEPSRRAPAEDRSGDEARPGVRHD